jgi:hypothetical protein
VIVSFETQFLQKTCLTIQIAEGMFGAVHAQALIALIADIEAFEDAGQVIDFFGLAAGCREDDSLFLPIGASYRARFLAAGKRFDCNANGKVVWSSVKRLKLMEIEHINEGRRN